VLQWYKSRNETICLRSIDTALQFARDQMERNSTIIIESNNTTTEISESLWINYWASRRIDTPDPWDVEADVVKAILEFQKLDHQPPGVGGQ